MSVFTVTYFSPSLWPLILEIVKWLFMVGSTLQLFTAQWASRKIERLEQNREWGPEGKMQESTDLCSSNYLIKNTLQLHPSVLMQVSKPLGALSIYKVNHYPALQSLPPSMQFSALNSVLQKNRSMFFYLVVALFFLVRIYKICLVVRKTIATFCWNKHAQRAETNSVCGQCYRLS